MPRHPHLRTWFTWLLALITVYAVLGVYGALARWSFLQTLALSVPAVYLPLRSAAIALGLGAAALALCRRWPRAELWARVAFCVFLGLVWFERLALARSDFAAINLPWLAFVSVLGLLLMWRATSLVGQKD
jgi:hypothetical protein